MLHIYGNPLSSPSNKVRYVANYLQIPYEFHLINLGAGEQQSADFLKINPLAKVPAIDDNGFTLAESNAILRYLADKQQSPLYPKDLQQRAKVDQWLDYAAIHVMMAMAKIMFNTYFYKFKEMPLDERSLQDGNNFINSYLPLLEKQLSISTFIAANTITIADIALLAALDTVEVCNVDLSHFPHLVEWRHKLMNEKFYTDYHENYAVTFTKVMAQAATKTS
jgi:glutathione S-transferase